MGFLHLGGAFRGLAEGSFWSVLGRFDPCPSHGLPFSLAHEMDEKPLFLRAKRPEKRFFPK